MQHVIPVDLTSPSPDRPQPIINADSEVKSAWIFLSRNGAGKRGIPLHAHPVDHMYFVVKSEINIQISTEQFMVGPGVVIALPKETPHFNWNDTATEEVHFELLVPAPERGKHLIETTFRDVPEYELSNVTGSVARHTQIDVTAKAKN